MLSNKCARCIYKYINYSASWLVYQSVATVMHICSEMTGCVSDTHEYSSLYLAV